MNERPIPDPRTAYRHFREITTRWADNFFASAAYPDTIHVGLRVTQMGSSSVRYEIGIFRNDEPRALQVTA